MHKNVKISMSNFFMFTKLSLFNICRIESASANVCMNFLFRKCKKRESCSAIMKLEIRKKFNFIENIDHHANILDILNFVCLFDAFYSLFNYSQRIIGFSKQF